MAREIPSTAVEIQTGLWLNKTPVVIMGVNYVRHEIYSAEDYCFYNKYAPEDERIYWQYASIGFNDISADFISIPLSELPEGAEIATKKPEIA